MSRALARTGAWWQWVWCSYIARHTQWEQIAPFAIQCSICGCVYSWATPSDRAPRTP